MSGPLTGVRVVEAAQYVAGPLCGALLAELGADVIKVEPPTGDAYRYVMPVAPGIGRFFVPLNRGKRSVVLDLKTGHGRDTLRLLAGSAEVLFHNFPPTRADHFGLGWDELHAALPRLVLGVVSSFGADGPLAGAPAYDLVAQARSGLLTAHASPGDTVPVRAGGIPMADLTAGHLLSTAVLAALLRARETGSGERVEVSLLAAAMAVQVQDLVWLADEAPTGAEAATRSDLEARAQEIQLGIDTNPYYRCFEAADGFFALACLNVEQRRAFLALFGLADETIEAPDLIPEDGAAVDAKRRLTTEIEQRIAQHPVATWLERLTTAGIPAGPVLAREAIGADPQVVANRLTETVEQPGLGAVTMLGRVFRSSDTSTQTALGHAPSLGADTKAVLAELGARG